MSLRNKVAIIVVSVAIFYAGVLFEHRESSVAPLQTTPGKTPAPAHAVTKIQIISTAASPAGPDFVHLPSGIARTKVTEAELNALAQNNPTVMAILQSIPDDINMGYLAMRVADKLTETDPDGAVSWALGLPAGEAKNAALDIVFGSWTLSNPEAALAKAQALPDDGPKGAQLRALSAVAAAWAVSDPAKGAALLDSLNQQEPNVSTENTTGEIAAIWLMQDSAAAAQWINTLPPGNSRDSAILSMVDFQGASEPASTFTWVRSMSNVAIRGRTTTQVIADWAKRDPAAATTAVLQAYPNNNNGRQAALLATIQQNAPTDAAPPQ